jgi:ribosomal protein S12 methylthiotransferase
VSQDTTRYGIDLYGKESLSTLLDELCKIEELKWIRILYCYPEAITDELVETIANQPKVVKYIDLPIQHINDKVLKLMNRRGNGQLIRDKIKLLRDKVEGIVIRSTVIVGFPGEGSKEFAELAEFLKEVKFERLGVFTFSCEEGTPAAKIKDGIVSEKTKQRRFDSLMQNQYDIHEKFNQKQVGKVLEVLCEGYDKASGVYFGRSKYDSPEIDGKVYFSSKARKIGEGEFVNVKITEVLDYDLLGEVVL